MKRTLSPAELHRTPGGSGVESNAQGSSRSSHGFQDRSRRHIGLRFRVWWRTRASNPSAILLARQATTPSSPVPRDVEFLDEPCNGWCFGQVSSLRRPAFRAGALPTELPKREWYPLQESNLRSPGS